MTKETLFGDLDLKSIRNNPDFKEDSVREFIVMPILDALHYKSSDIVLSKSLNHPFLKVGANKKIPIKLVPDYCLKVENNYAWVLDAKSPDVNIMDEDNIEQVYCYVSNPEIRSTYFALCNGIEFSLYRRESTNSPILYFQIDEIQYHWESLNRYLSTNSFQIGKYFSYDTLPSKLQEETFNYNIRPFLKRNSS